MSGSLRVMRDWLVEAGVTIAAMESTSVYWKAPFYCLEEVMEVWLLNAAHMKAVPGRKPGRGKSTTVKVFALRMLGYGYRTLVLGDTKDEYEPLCRALGVEPFVLGPGLPTRVNPLAFGPLGHGWHRLGAAEARRREAVVFARWLVLLRGLVGSQAVPFGPVEETAVGEALRLLTGYRTAATRLTEPTIPQLWHALDDPAPELVEACRYA